MDKSCVSTPPDDPALAPVGALGADARWVAVDKCGRAVIVVESNFRRRHTLGSRLHGEAPRRV